MSSEKYDLLAALFDREMVPALGCTDPIGIAFCSATAARHVTGEILRVDAMYSMNLIKNVAAVSIPKTGGLCGARIATALGVMGGKPEKKLEALEDLTSEQIQDAIALEKSEKLKVSIADTDVKLYMRVTVTTSEGSATAEIQDDYTKVTSIIVNGETILDQSVSESDDESLYRYDLLCLDSILDFAENAPFDKLSRIEDAVRMNTALAKEALKGSDDTPLSKLMRSFYPGRSDTGATDADQFEKTDFYRSALLWSSAGVDARMSGCSLPAMSNTGSGNQGIVSTMPVYGAAQVFGSDYEDLIRAVAVSCLVTIYIKHKLGALSTVCGGVVAASGSGCGITWLRGGRKEEMIRVLKNMFGNLAGLLCDGAKTSCALKTATCVHAACMASDLALHGFALAENNGIVGKAEADTIDYFVRASNEGLVKMDGVVLDIIMNK